MDDRRSGIKSCVFEDRGRIWQRKDASLAVHTVRNSSPFIRFLFIPVYLRLCQGDRHRDLRRRSVCSLGCRFFCLSSSSPSVGRQELPGIRRRHCERRKFLQPMLPGVLPYVSRRRTRSSSQMKTVVLLCCKPRCLQQKYSTTFLHIVSCCWCCLVVRWCCVVCNVK